VGGRESEPNKTKTKNKVMALSNGSPRDGEDTDVIWEELSRFHKSFLNASTRIPSPPSPPRVSATPRKRATRYGWSDDEERIMLTNVVAQVVNGDGTFKLDPIKFDVIRAIFENDPYSVSRTETAISTRYVFLSMLLSFIW